MKNRLAAITRRSIPYNPEFRKLPLVKSVTAAILLQQLDYWFDSYETFYKFLEPAPNHYSYREGDSWTEELSFSAEEFTSAFKQIGVQYKSWKSYNEADQKFVSSGIEYYYASYIDRRRGITHYVRNHKLLDSELTKLGRGKEIVRKQKPEYHEEVRERIERIERIEAEQAVEQQFSSVEQNEQGLPSERSEQAATSIVQPMTAPVAAAKPKRTPEEMAAEKATKEEQKRLRSEAKAKAEQERLAQIEADNKWRYDIFGSKERYMRFNAWFWGTYVKGSTLDNPGMFYQLVFNNLKMGGEKYRGIISMFEMVEQKQAEEAKVQAIVTESQVDAEEQYFISKLTEEELAALNEANLEPGVYNFCIRQMEHQTHSMRLRTIASEKVKQELVQYRNQLQQRIEADS